jgi:TolA-binding protein
MIEKLKLYLYPLLVVLVIWFAWGFYHNYTKVHAARVAAEQQRLAAEQQQDSTTPPTSSDTNNASTNAAVAVTNATADTNLASTNQSTNAPTNATAAVTPAPKPKKVATEEASGGSTMGYLFALVISLILLGVLIAYDVTQYMGNQAVDFLFNDNGEGQRDPEYEHAEHVWAQGNHLEAIQLMRDYLKKNPREQYVALRIAEIYEKDLKNPLAAALEYEEILKQKLPPEHWGKAAIHLCNVYTRLGQQDKTQALLQRIITEHPKTAAAKKARSKLGLPEHEIVPPTPPEDSVSETEPAPETADLAKSNLPPGFRPKK